MKYEEALDYLSKLSIFGTRLRLDTTLELLDFLGNPHKKYKTIHVAGTNGKGSVCAMLNSILGHSGLSTGMYTSPPLMIFTERIMVDGEQIDTKDVARLTELVMPKVEKMILGKKPPTFFEVITVMAFKYFEEKNVDVAIMEVGLGGRLDATNVISPMVSVITNVQKDHTSLLGENVQDIAREKAGVIKGTTPLVTAETDKNALNVLKSVCKKRNAQLFVVGEDAKFKIKKSDTGRQIFDYMGMKEYENLEIRLLGRFQIKNAVTALAAAELLGFQIPESAIRTGLKGAKWPGRMELIDKKGKVLLDCAHNPSGARELARTINDLFNAKASFVLGTSAGKDVKGILKELSQVGGRFVITKSNHQNAEKTEKIADEVKKITGNYIIQEKVSDALSYALSNQCEREIICVTGSIFVVGEAMRVLRNEMS